MKSTQRYDLFLSISLCARGFGFVLAEGPLNLVDWGVVRVKATDKNKRCIQLVETLVRRNLPDVLFLEDARHQSFHRSIRIRKLNRTLCMFAQEMGIPVLRASREDIRNAFAPYGAFTKNDIALVIAERIPILARYVPPKRKAWMTEDHRMALFDAVAIMLAALQSQEAH